MIKKIVKQGNGAGTVCLPKKWLIKNSLTFGSDVKVMQKASQIIIVPLKNNIMEVFKMDIDFKIKSFYFIKYIVFNCYRLGYNRIELNFKYELDKQIYQELVDLVEYKIEGYDIFKNKNEIIIENKINIEDINLNTIMQKLLILITETFELLSDEENLKNFKEDFSNLDRIHKNIIKNQNLVRKYCSQETFEKSVNIIQISKEMISIVRFQEKIIKSLSLDELIGYSDFFFNLKQEFEEVSFLFNKYNSNLRSKEILIKFESLIEKNHINRERKNLDKISFDAVCFSLERFTSSIITSLLALIILDSNYESN